MKDKLSRMLALHEGRKNVPYYDSLGYVTWGIGHLCDPRKPTKIPDHIVDAMFEHDLQEHTKLLPGWAFTDLDDVRLAVLIDMTFNLGPEPFDGDGFKDWPKFVSQLRTGEYKKAAANMRSTLWAKQVGVRAERLATMMETGEWPHELS